MKRLSIAVAILMVGAVSTGSISLAAAKTAPKSKTASSKKAPKPSPETINWGKTQCDKADKYLQQGQYEKARDLYSQILWKLPASPRAKNGLKQAEAAIVAKQNHEKQAAQNAEKTGAAEAKERLEIDRKVSGAVDAIKWENSYANAAAAAQQVGKPILISCNADWCPQCKKLDAETWKNPQVMALSRSFVCVRIEEKDKTSIQAVGGTDGWPTIIFQDPSGKEIKRVAGFYPPQEMLDVMREALAGPKPIMAE